MGDDGRCRHPEADDVVLPVACGTYLGHPLVDQALEVGRHAQPTVALGEVDPRQPGVELGPTELRGCRRRRVVGREQLLEPLLDEVAFGHA